MNGDEQYHVTFKEKQFHATFKHTHKKKRLDAMTVLPK